MTQKLQQNQWAKVGIESWWLNHASPHTIWDPIRNSIFFLFILLLPTQLGKHFWPNFSFVLGQRVDFLSPTLYATDILLLILFLITISHKKIRISPLFSCSILFIALCIFFSASPLAGWYWLIKFLEMSFLVWYITKIQINEIRVGILLSVGVIFESLLAVAQIIAQGSIGGVLYFLGERSFTSSTPGIANASIAGQLVLRPYATFSHPNMLAGYLVICMLLVVFFLGIRKGVLQVLVFLTLIVGTSGLALSLGRVGIFTWVLIGILSIVITFHERVSKPVLFLVMTAGITFLLTAVFFPTIISRLFSFSFGDALGERIVLAQNAFSMIFSDPVLGVGPNNFISSLPVFAKNGIILQPVHNIYLLVAAELGIPGLLLFLGFMYTLAKSLFIVWKKNLVSERNHILLLGLALFAILFSGFFDHYFLTLQQGQLLFALVIGLILREQSTLHGTIQK